MNLAVATHYILRNREPVMGATKKMAVIPLFGYSTLLVLFTVAAPVGYDSLTWVIGGLVLFGLAIERIYSQIDTARTAVKLAEYGEQLEAKEKEIEQNCDRLERAFKLIDAQRQRNDAKDELIRRLQADNAELRGIRE